VVDDRLTADGVCAGTGYFSHADLPVWKLGVTVQRSAAGRVTSPPPPRVAILSHAQIPSDHVLVARDRCKGGLPSRLLGPEPDEP
jgi:hypothetical protein